MVSLLILIIFAFNAEFIENKGILFTFKSTEPLKGVGIFYSPSGKNYYAVAVKRYSFPDKDIEDTLLWVFRPVENKIFDKVKEKGRIKVVYLKWDGQKYEEVIELKNLKVSNNFFIREKEESISNFSHSYDYGRYPSWRMF